jgi:hypothetical protein
MWARPARPELVLPPAQAVVFRAAVGCLSDFIGWEGSDGGWEAAL